MSNFKDTNSCPDGYRALSTSELQELIQNEDKMDQIVLLDEKFQEMQVDREMLLASNRNLAEESLAQRPRLNNGKLQLAEKYKELSNLSAACWEKQSQLGNHVQKHSLQMAQNLLHDEVARAELHSEETLQNFLEGGLPLERFLETFQSSRKAYHIRRAQAEKINEVAQASRQPGVTKKTDDAESKEVKKDTEPKQEPHRQQQQRPNGFVAQGPPRFFQLRYGLTPAILVPHYPLSPPTSAALSSAPSQHSSIPPPEPQLGQTHILSPSPISGHGQPVGLRVIGQLQGGWPASGRPVRLQQLYRPSPQQPEPPFR